MVAKAKVARAKAGKAKVVKAKVVRAKAPATIEPVRSAGELILPKLSAASAAAPACRARPALRAA